MAKQALDIAGLLDPVPRALFLNDYWEKQPLHVKRLRSDFYDGVLTLGDLEELIAAPGTRYPAIQLSKGGAYFPAGVYCEDVKFGAEVFTAVVIVSRVAAEYRAGATIVLPALHRTWEPLASLCRGLDSELDHVAHANCYLTPGNTAGFTPHYDTHEVLVLQIAGRKNWRVYEPPIELPHRKQPFTPSGYALPAKPLLEAELAAGDLLYLPRGYVHTTTTSSEHSAHITIGIDVYTWIDLAGELLQSALSSPRLRAALPMGFASRPEVSVVLAKQLHEVLSDLIETADEGKLVEMFLSRVRGAPYASRTPFRADVMVIHADTLLEAPAPESYRIVQQGAKVAVEFQQRRFIFPAEARATLEAIRQRKRFRPSDLDGTLDIESKLTLVRSLHERAFLEICRPELGA